MKPSVDSPVALCHTCTRGLCIFTGELSGCETSRCTPTHTFL